MKFKVELVLTNVQLGSLFWWFPAKKSVLLRGHEMISRLEKKKTNEATLYMNFFKKKKLNI